jgi:hypothetical protein
LLLSTKDKKQGCDFFSGELAEYFRVSVQWVYDHDCKLPHFTFGGLITISGKNNGREIRGLSPKVKSKKRLDF